VKSPLSVVPAARERVVGFPCSGPARHFTDTTAQRSGLTFVTESSRPAVRFGPVFGYRSGLQVTEQANHTQARAGSDAHPIPPFTT
jgi:hypothetical protein